MIVSYDFIISTARVFLLWFLIPVFIITRCFLRKRFFSTGELIYYVISIPMIGFHEGGFFSLIYVFVFLAFVIWWSCVFTKYKENNPKNYAEYKQFYSEYFSDDLNNDGIKDAFENWEIAHDPRFFWLFGSRRAKQQRQLENNFFGQNMSGGWGAFGQTKSPEQEFNEWSASHKNGTYYQNTGSYGSNRSSDNRSYRNTAGGYAGSRSNTASGTNNNYYGTKPESEMSDVEKEVAKQHAFARKYNLRYFAMCKSKTEAKKLYHKYATKFHPDNAVTGDKEKFMKIDEEYNRFCEIPEIK